MQVRLQIAMVCMVYIVSHPPPWRGKDGLGQQIISNSVHEGDDKTAGALQVLSPTSTCSKYDCPMHELFWANYSTAAAFFSFLYRKCEIPSFVPGHWN